MITAEFPSTARSVDDSWLKSESVDWHSVNIIQLEQTRFNNFCLTDSTSSMDYTGLRVYSGASILVRFLCSSFGKTLTFEKNVCELGSGTGVAGLLCFKSSNFKDLVLTDGNPRALELAQMNANNLITLNRRHLVQVHQLMWSKNEEDITRFKEAVNNSSGFDVVMGCELTYFCTDMTELAATVFNLCCQKVDRKDSSSRSSSPSGRMSDHDHNNNSNDTGMFLHAHLFRREYQDKELIEALHAYGWSSIHVPFSTFLTLDDLNVHPEWYSVCCIISASHSVIESLLGHNPSLRPFEGYQQACDDNARYYYSAESVGQSSFNRTEASLTEERENDFFGRIFG